MNRISIITICFNNLNDVLKTSASIDKQAALPFEHLIIDGSTTPDIKNYLENNEQPPYRRWICERDKGISDAFNKGISNARGDILYLLNSGDEMYDDTVLTRVKTVFDSDSGIMWCNGKLNIMRGGAWVIVGKPFEKSKLYRGMRSVFHPTMYVRKEVYDRRGLFDTGIKMAMDYDFLCRIADERSAFIDYPLATFDPTGISSAKYLDAMHESFASYEKYYGKTMKQTLWGWRLTLLHYLLETRLGKWLFKLKRGLGMENV